MQRTPSLLKLNNTSYRGGIIVKRFSNSDLTVINTVTLDEYLYGVVPKEMARDWPIEALKAQAVAARNYAITSMGKHKAFGFDLCAGPDCQVYGGFSIEAALSNQAVDETTNKILMYDDKVVQAFFHSNSGGQTEDSENVWKEAIPYLKGVPDEFSVGAPNTDWSKVFTKEEIEQRLKDNQMDVGLVTDISVTSRSTNGRVLVLTIRGSRGETVLNKEQTRKVLGYNDVKSTWFEVEGNTSVRAWQADGPGDLEATAYVVGEDGLPVLIPLSGLSAQTVNGPSQINALKGDTVKISGHGWGHGLGLSQWGAKKMAESGYTYEDILKYYYTGAYLQ